MPLRRTSAFDSLRQPAAQDMAPRSPIYTHKSASQTHLIVEKTRTVFVTTSPPNQWDSSGRSRLLSLNRIDSSLSPTRHREHGGSQSVRLSPKSPVAPCRKMRMSHSAMSPESPESPSSPFSPFTPGSPSSARSLPLSLRPKILFYDKDKPYYGFTNFSSHPVTYRGKVYPTSEHLFQSFKFLDHRPLLAEHLRTYSSRPSVVFSEARRFAPEVRRDWMDVNIKMMDEALWHKFTQHPALKAELLSTGNAELVEDSDKDAFWGIGADGKGRNELGKALERLRDQLRS